MGTYTSGPSSSPAAAAGSGSGAVFGRKFCAKKPANLVFSLKDGIAVTDPSSGDVFFIFLTEDGSRRLIEVATGKTLITMKRKLPSMHGRWEAFRGDSKDPKDLLFSVKRSSIMVQFGTQLEVFLAGNTTQEDVCDFTIKGEYSNKSCVFYKGNSTNICVAEMRKGLPGVLMEIGSFAVTLNPNTDKAFIAALIVILKINHDEVVEKDKK